MAIQVSVTTDEGLEVPTAYCKVKQVLVQDFVDVVVTHHPAIPASEGVEAVDAYDTQEYIKKVRNYVQVELYASEAAYTAGKRVLSASLGVALVRDTLPGHSISGSIKKWGYVIVRDALTAASVPFTNLD